MKEKNESYSRRLAAFIAKDTSGKNESMRIVVIIRILILTYIVYFAFNLFLCSFFVARAESVAVFFLFLLASVAMFVLSYHYETTVVLWSFIVSTLIWVLSVVHFLGWDTGVQHFMMILLVLYFFSRYRNYLGKVLFMCGLVGMRIWMFSVYNDRIPILELRAEQITALQILNTVTIFWSLSVVAFICSESSQELEGKLVEYNRQLEMQANTDALTGLYNRRYGMDQLMKTMKEQPISSLCIADVDFFKKINDNYGHDSGDEVLKSLANVFRQEMQGCDMVARWGGEEFLFLFAGRNGEYALEKLEDLRQKVNKMKICKDEKEIHVTMTFGIAEFNPYEGLDATLKEADEKLYIGKERGRDCVVY